MHESNSLRTYTFADLWAIVRSGKYIIVGFTALTTASATIGSYLVRPTFVAETLIAPVIAPNSGLGALTAQLGVLTDFAPLLGHDPSAATMIATLKSRSLTEGFISEKKLLPVLFEERWDASSGRWKSDAPTTWDAYQVFEKGLRVISEDRKTGLITLKIEWHDPEAAADWANELVQRANTRLKEDTISEAQRTVRYLQAELEKASSVEVRQTLYGLIEAETKKIAVAYARDQFAFKVIDPAVVPRTKNKPKRLLIITFGFFFGLVASFLIASSTMDHRKLV